MSTLPINNSVSINPNVLAQDREVPVFNKANDPLLSKSFTNTVVLDNGKAGKNDSVTMSRAVFEQFFDMLESFFKSIRSMWAGQGGSFKPMADKGGVPEVRPEAKPDSTPLSNSAKNALAKTDAQPKVMSEADSSTQLLKDLTSKISSDKGEKPKVAPESKPDPKSLPVIASKVLADAAQPPKPMPQIKPQPLVVSGDDPKMRKEVDALTKTFSGEVPGVRLDAAQQSKQTSDINLMVQVLNCGFHHPEAKGVVVAPRLDGQPRSVPNMPNKLTVDGQSPVVPNTPATFNVPVVDGQPTVVPQPPVIPGADIKPLTSQPEFTPDIRSKVELTAPGPADDRAEGVFDNRNRNRFDSLWRSNADRRTKA